MSRIPSVGIAILNWNGRHFLQTLLTLLQELSYPDYTIYVIDNNSTDDSIVFLKEHFPVARCRAAWVGSTVRLYGYTRTNTSRDLISNDGQ